MNTLGDRIRLVRGEISQTIFSEKIGITQNTLSRYERNQRVPDAQFIVDLCDSFNISTDWLLLGHGSMRPENTKSTHSLPEYAPTPQAACARCAKLEGKLEAADAERRELTAENRQLWRENGELKAENGELKARIARLEAGIDRRAETPVEASLFDERPPIPSSSQATPLADKSI